MRISTKLKLSSLVVLALLVLNAAVAVFFIHRMMEDVRQLAEVEETDRILDDENQTEIHEQIQRVAMDARRSGERAIVFMLVAGLFIFAIVIGVGRLVSNGIIAATSRLTEGAAEIGGGNLDHRIEARTEDELGVLAAAFNEMADKRQRSDRLMKGLVEGTAAHTGAEFFPSFARALSGVFESRYILICEHLDSPAPRVRTLAFWMHDHLEKNVEYDTTGGPCEAIAIGETTFYPRGLQALFPEDKMLVDLNAESYCGIPLTDSLGQLIGHLAFLDDGPMDLNLCEVPALQVFVSRASAELERKRMESALRESELRLKTVVSDAPVIITSVNRNGEIDLFEGRALDSVGFQPGQFVGEDYFELWQDRSYMTDSMRECLTGHTPAPTTLDISDRLLETRYSPMRDADGQVTGAITVCVDITERVRAEEALRNSELRTRSLLESSPICNKIIDLDFKLQYMSAAGRNQLKIVDIEPFYGCSFPSELYPESFRQPVIECLERAKGGETANMECPVHDTEGRVMWFDTTFVPARDKEGRVEYIVVSSVDITERKKTEQALRLSEDRLDLAFHGTLDGLWDWDIETDKEYWSPRFKELLGYAEDEIEATFDQFAAFLHPKDKAGVLEATRLHLEENQPYDREFRMRTKSGEYHWFQSRGQALRDENGEPYRMAGTIRDITERKIASDKLSEINIALSNAMPGISRLDTAGRYLQVNDFYAHVLGYEPNDLIGNEWSPTVHPEDRAVALQAYEEMCRVGKCGFEARAVRKDGSLFHKELLMVRIDAADGSMVGHHCFMRDITERKEAEEERATLEAQLRQQQKLESIGTLAGGVAHEINNPINGIMNYAQLIGERLDPESPLREFADGIGQETERVATIVRNLLAFAGQEMESHGPANIADIVNDTLSLIRTIIRQDQITLLVDVADDIPEFKCRSQQIQQVLMNLLTNARDALNARYPAFDDDKIVTLTVRPFEKEGGRWIRITVEDHGIGIPDEIRDRLFDPFFTTKDRTKGTGLGLSISLGIVQDHLGELSFESGLDGYTRFFLELPMDTRLTIGETPDIQRTEREAE